MNGTHLRLAWLGDGSCLRLTGPNLRLPWPSRLYLWTVVWFAGPVLRLSGSRDLPWPSIGLTGAVDLPRTTAWVGTTNSGLCSDRPGSRDQSGAALVHVVELLAILRGLALVLDLGGHRRSAGPAEGRDLCRPWPYVNAAATAVIGDPRPVIDDHVAVVNMSDVDDVHPVDGAVVVEVVAVPITAIVAISGVAEAVVYAAIEADMQTPVATIETPAVVVPAPVSGRPKRSVVGRGAPRPGNPVIACWRPIPVTWSPDIVGRGGFGLLIFG